jgi:acetyl esterase/lipase
MYEPVHKNSTAADAVSMGDPMKFAMVVLAVLLGVSQRLHSSPATGDVKVAAAPVLDDRYPRRVVSFAGDVESFADLVYSTPPGYRPLHLDLYKQRSAIQPRPLVIYIHGGGWQGGHTRHSGAFANWPEVLASLAARGYVVASLEYRLSGEATFPAAIQDVKNAIRWLRLEADQFGIDPLRVVVWGGSAGGHLAALAATTCKVAKLDPPASPASAQSDCVQGLVAWYGIFDLSNLNADSPVSRFLGCAPSQCADVATRASPVTYIDAGDPPVLLIHGEKDKVVAVGQSQAFQVALRAKNVRTELLTIPGVDHSFIGSSPEATQRASLEALSSTFAFIDSVAGGSR